MPMYTCGSQASKQSSAPQTSCHAKKISIYNGQWTVLMKITKCLSNQLTKKVDFDGFSFRFSSYNYNIIVYIFVVTLQWSAQQ